MGFNQQNCDFNGIYHLVICEAVCEFEHGPVEKVDFQINSMVIFLVK